MLLSRLTRNRLQKDELKNQYISVSTPYDPAGFDVPTILRQMMFYRAAGGQNYVGLLHRSQPFVDMSEHLDLNRGLLVGFCQEPAGCCSAARGRKSRPSAARRTCTGRATGL